MKQNVLRLLTEIRYPDFKADQLASAPPKNHFIVKLPVPIPGWPEYLVGRIDNILGAASSTLLYNTYERFMNTRPRLHGKILREEARCDPTQSIFFHVGIWSKSSKDMYLTRDTRMQSQATKDALCDILTCLHEVAIPKMCMELRKRIPTHFYTTDQ